jgi:hypothetical protein
LEAFLGSLHPRGRIGNAGLALEFDIRLLLAG